MIGNRNGWDGDRVRKDKTDAFGILDENENGSRVGDFCTEKVTLSIQACFQDLSVGSRINSKALWIEVR